MFRRDNFNKAIAAISDKGGDSGNWKIDQQNKHKRLQKGIPSCDNQLFLDYSSIYKIISMIMLKSYQPVIVFSFSRKDCENYAVQISKLDFNTEEEIGMVVQVFESAMNSLQEEDKNLPQIGQLLPLLKRGIGIHHSGLLPILKETVEILFQEGLIKVSPSYFDSIIGFVCYRNVLYWT